MEDNISQQTFGKKVFILSALIIAFMLLGQFLSAGLMFAYYGNDAFNFEKILSNKNDSFNFIRLIQIAISIFSFALPAIIFSKIYHKNACSYSFEQHKSNVLLWLIVPFLIIRSAFIFLSKIALCFSGISADILFAVIRYITEYNLLPGLSLYAFSKFL